MPFLLVSLPHLLCKTTMEDLILTHLSEHSLGWVPHCSEHTQHTVSLRGSILDEYCLCFTCTALT